MRQQIIQFSRTVIVVAGDPAHDRPALFLGNTIKMAQNGLAGTASPRGRIDKQVIKETDILTTNWTILLILM